MAEMQDIFHDLDGITLNILKERAANYLFNDDIRNDSSEIDSDVMNAEFEIESDDDERIIELLRFSKSLKNVRGKWETVLKVGDFHNSSDFR